MQRGKQPSDFKPMPKVGKGVEERRLWDETWTYRGIYIARLEEAVYVFHAFQKKTQATHRDLSVGSSVANHTWVTRGRVRAPGPLIIEAVGFRSPGSDSGHPLHSLDRADAFETAGPHVACGPVAG